MDPAHDRDREENDDDGRQANQPKRLPVHRLRALLQLDLIRQIRQQLAAFIADFGIVLVVEHDRPSGVALRTRQHLIMELIECW